MAVGMRGARPLGEATRLAFAMRDEDCADVHVLGWNPATRSPTLADISGLVDNRGDPVALATALDGSESFMSVSYDALARLQPRYRSATLLTDVAVEETTWLRVRRLQPAPERYIYIASAVWDEVEGRSMVRFVTAGGAGLSSLWQVLDDGSLARTKPEEYRIEPGTNSFVLSFAHAGLWAVQWEGHILPFEAPGAPGSYRTDGEFASRIAAALYPLGARPAGTAGAAADIVVRDAGGRNRPGGVSVARADRQVWVLDPERTLGPAALAAPQTAMPFWLARAAADGRIAGSDRVPTSATAVRVGDGFLYVRQGQPPAALIVPPISEYAHDPRPIVVQAAPAGDTRLGLALALALLYTAKILAARSIAAARRTVFRPGRASRGSAPQNQA